MSDAQRWWQQPACGCMSSDLRYAAYNAALKLELKAYTTRREVNGIMVLSSRTKSESISRSCVAQQWSVPVPTGSNRLPTGCQWKRCPANMHADAHPAGMLSPALVSKAVPFRAGRSSFCDLESKGSEAQLASADRTP